MIKPGIVSAAPLKKIVGVDYQSQDGVVKFTIGREGSMHGVKVGASMGLTTWAAFFGTDDAAIMDGDFIMTGPEVQPVLRSLRNSKINVVALHNHMIGESPKFYFTHFWGKGSPTALAQALKDALDAQAAVPNGED